MKSNVDAASADPPLQSGSVPACEGLYLNLKEGADAPISEFTPLDIEALLQQAKERQGKQG